jgi:tryptophan-rich sensory protein
MPHPALTFPLAAVAMNGFIYGFGWNQGQGRVTNTLLPPGYVIALVWIVLFALLGTVYASQQKSLARTAILVYLGYCLAYPLLTSGLQMGQTADLLNAGALLGALGLIWVVGNNTGRFPWLLTPLLAWTLYVNAVGYFRPKQ